MTHLPAAVARLITVPQVDGWVAQRNGRRFQLCWRLVADAVHIYLAGETAVWLATVHGAQETWVEVPETAVRPLFELRFSGGAAAGQCLPVAERLLPLAGGANFRDLGGYRTADGRYVRWGAVYRAGHLGQLTPADQRYVQQLGLQLVCDLRTSAEADRYPDQLPTTVTYCHLPMQSRDGRLRQLFDVYRYRHQLSRLMVRGYMRIVVEQNKPVMATILQQLANSANLPAVIHCTAGKDRTGVLAALLLCLLGVPEEVVVADYSLSNLFYPHLVELLQQDVARLNRLGFDESRLQPFYVADPLVLQATLAAIRQTYGSVRGYIIQGVGLSEAVVEQLGANLLLTL